MVAELEQMTSKVYFSLSLMVEGVAQVVEEGRRLENSGKRFVCALGIQGSEEAVLGRV